MTKPLFSTTPSLMPFEDSHGDIWICNENGGLHLYSDIYDNFTRFLPDPDDRNSISNISIKTVCEDDHGRLWIGTHLAGIDVHDKFRLKFEHYFGDGTEASLRNNVVRSFYEDDKENLWIATDGGGFSILNRETNTYQTFFSGNSNLNMDAILTIEEDKRGLFWIGTWRGGVNIFDPKSQTFSQPFSQISTVSRVFYIIRGSDDRMWVADQLGGLNLFSADGEFIRAYDVSKSSDGKLANNGVVVIHEDSEQRIWIGTGDNGLNLLVDEDNFENPFKIYSLIKGDSTSIPNVRINDIHEDSFKNLWIASDGGLSKYLPESDNFRNYHQKHGLATSAVKSIEEDDNGVLWLGTAKGVTRFDAKNGVFRNYSHHDGLQPGVFSRYAAKKLKSGELVFGGYNGFNIFYPDSLVDNPYPPRIQFTGLKVFNETVDITAKNAPIDRHISESDEIILQYNQSVFTISYVGINYTLSDRNSYSYRLKGFENKWNYVGNKMEATYTNLDPGDYIFEVKAANNDGLWSEEATSIRVTVIPPWWQTLYFRIFLIATAIAIVLAYIKYRTYSLEKQQLLLESEVKRRTDEVKKLNQDLTITEKMASLGVLTTGIAHEINNPLNFISGASQKLFEILERVEVNGKLQGLDSEDTVKNLKKIIKVGINRASQIVGSLRNFVKDDSGTFESFDIISCLDDSLMILRHKFKRHEIRINKDVPLSLDMVCLPGRISQVFVNLLSNAIDAIDEDGEISIKIYNHEDEVFIQVTDNGKGISKEELSRLFDPFYSTKDIGKGTGLGLYIVYGIVEEHQGKIDVRSDENGTTFEISMPVNLPIAQLN